MASKKKYRVFCVTESASIEAVTVQDTPPHQCPNNAEHQIRDESVSVVVEYRIDNLTADRAPTIDDDIEDGYAVGSRWRWGALEWLCADNAAGAAVWTPVVTGYFGTGFHYCESLGATQSNATSWQNKLICDLGTTPAGLYLAAFYYETRVSKGNFDGFARLRVDDDDAKILHENIFMPWKSGSAIVPVGGTIPFTLTNAAHHIDIEFKSSDSQNTVTIQKARLSVWRAA